MKWKLVSICRNRYYAGLTGLVLLLLLLAGSATAEAAAWKLSRNFWSEEDEKAYSNFIVTLGRSKHSNLNRFIKDPKTNPLYGEEDKKFNLSADCADLPYLIRAYVAYKLRIPFSYTASIAGRGGDQRYSKGNRPTSFKDQDYFKSPQHLFNQVVLVNSGYFRTTAEIEDSDFYPVKITRKSVVPGTIYYDPDGHIAIVYEVEDNGRIRVFDAHPDHSISKPWFGAKFTRGSKENGGGFKRWRPIRYTSEGKIIRTRNHNLPDYSADDQYRRTFSARGRQGIGYHEYVRLTLCDDARKNDPVSEFAFMMKDLHEDISYRAVAVSLSIEKGINKRSHPGALPWNIYGTDGIWEEFSTPSRDARLKVAFREFYDRTRQMIIEAEQNHAAGGPAYARQLAAAFLQQYQILNQQLSVSYVNSLGKRILLSFDDISNRLFDMSFDPYHSIEFRWGAQGEELASSPDDQTKRRFYQLEYRLRNQLERVYNQSTPLSMGPESPPMIDVCGWLAGYLRGQSVDATMLAFNREVIAPLPPVQPAETSKPQEPAQKQATALAVSAKSVKTETAATELSAKKAADKGKIWDSLLETGDVFAAAMVNPDNFVVASED
ncbi:MAG: hypothetical protein CVV42_00290 [Candidatus Riflebacteria bacterium HGW-Riflebacteria-2]|nr:MAG: hypothetical protein CVV42_00290 [Candidatus Riflebacteria bacterium HGW-Riflebacteria-2]